MKRSVAKLLLVGVLLSSLVIGLTSACAKPAPAPSPSPAPKPSAPAPTPSPAPKPPAPAPTPSPAPPKPAAPKVPEKVTWDLSLWSPAKALNYPVERWAEDMKTATNGRWEIRLHYGEVLAKAALGLDGVKAKSFEAALISTMYHPGKTPLRGVFENPFFAPPTIAQAGEWINAVVPHPAIQKEMDSWNVKVVFSFCVGPYEYMGKKPFKKVEDLKGQRIRLDPISGRPLEAFGAVMNNIPGPEIYTALERGLIDSVIFAWPYTFSTYKLNELSKYATVGLELKVADMYVACGKDAWNALPDEWKKLSDAAAAKTMERYLEFRKQNDAKDLELFAKQQLEITPLAPGERAKLVEKAKPSWEAWVKEIDGKGLPGKEIFNFAQTKRDEIIAKSKK